MLRMILVYSWHCGLRHSCPTRHQEGPMDITFQGDCGTKENASMNGFSRPMRTLLQPTPFKISPKLAHTKPSLFPGSSLNRKNKLLESAQPSEGLWWDWSWAAGKVAAFVGTLGSMKHERKFWCVCSCKHVSILQWQLSICAAALACMWAGDPLWQKH